MVIEDAFEYTHTLLLLRSSARTAAFKWLWDNKSSWSLYVICACFEIHPHSHDNVETPTLLRLTKNQSASGCNLMVIAGFTTLIYNIKSNRISSTVYINTFWYLAIEDCRSRAVSVRMMQGQAHVQVQVYFPCGQILEDSNVFRGRISKGFWV